MVDAVSYSGRGLGFIQYDVNDFPLVCFHVLHKKFFARRLKATNTATEEQDAQFCPRPDLALQFLSVAQAIMQSIHLLVFHVCYFWC